MERALVVERAKEGNMRLMGGGERESRAVIGENLCVFLHVLPRLFFLCIFFVLFPLFGRFNRSGL